jgi:hypothetical protein
MKTDSYKPRALEHIYLADPAKACRLALRRTIKVREAQRIEAINQLLGTFGTYAIRKSNDEVIAVYCNAVGFDLPTVIEVLPDRSSGRSRFIVSTVREFIERNTGVQL